MPRRKVVLATGEVYHIYNRSIAKAEVFKSVRDLNKAIEVVNFYRYPQRLRLSVFKQLKQEVQDVYIKSFKNLLPLVEIYSYCFMPNHFHFLIKQLRDNGISRFIANFQNSFAKIFNLRHDRNGALFQNQFKAKRPDTDEEFLHLSRYIHLNPVTAFLVEFRDLLVYPYTSLVCYVGGDNEDLLVNTKIIIEMVGSVESYVKFVSDQADYQRELDLIKNLTLE